MLVYRVHPWLPSARPGDPGHPRYVHRSAQGHGRLDNPEFYAAVYVAEQPQGAVGESLGHLRRWSDEHLHPTGSQPRALTTYEMDERGIFDLDDCRNLSSLGLRPSDVVRRNRDHTQEVALRVFLERKPPGVRWWSYHRPEWRIVALFGAASQPDPFEGSLSVVDTSELTTDHPAVVNAAHQLDREIA